MMEQVHFCVGQANAVNTEQLTPSTHCASHLNQERSSVVWRVIQTEWGRHHLCHGQFILQCYLAYTIFRGSLIAEESPFINQNLSASIRMA